MLREILVAGVVVMLCLLIHVAGLLLLAEWLILRPHLIEGKKAILRYSVVLVTLFTAILFLHTVETSLWASFYYLRGLFSDFETSLYFSVSSYAAIGYGDILLPQRWRLVGAIEGVTGVLLCGISTAFIFAVINALFQRRRA